jgi:GR25 family glycosyltransferase involved in LPS biosynthesis
VRTCTCDKDTCRRCHLYHHDPRYRSNWDKYDPAPPPAPVTIRPAETYVVSLERRPDRREKFALEAVRETLPFKFFDAVDGTTVPLPDGWEEGVSSGANGCRLSHVGILEDALARGLDAFLVLEDDAVLVPGFVAKLGRLVDDVTRLDPQWDAIFVGGQHHRKLGPPHATTDPNVLRVTSCVRTHGFVLRGGEYTKGLLDLWRAGRTHIDHLWAYGDYQKNYKVYAPRKWLCYQSDGVSDITGLTRPLRQWQPSRVVEPRKRCGSCRKGG